MGERVSLTCEIGPALSLSSSFFDLSHVFFSVCVVSVCVYVYLIYTCVYINYIKIYFWDRRGLKVCWIRIYILINQKCMSALTLFFEKSREELSHLCPGFPI